MFQNNFICSNVLFQFSFVLLAFVLLSECHEWSAVPNSAGLLAVGHVTALVASQ